MSVCGNVNIVSYDKYFIPTLISYEIKKYKSCKLFTTVYKWHREI